MKKIKQTYNNKKLRSKKECLFSKNFNNWDFIYNSKVITKWKNHKNKVKQILNKVFEDLFKV